MRAMAQDLTELILDRAHNAAVTMDEEGLVTCAMPTTRASAIPGRGSRGLGAFQMGPLSDNTAAIALRRRRAGETPGGVQETQAIPRSGTIRPPARRESDG
jgi:hypothetical protein